MTQHLSRRYRVIILGGGIHGAGIAHDLASRGWRDVLLLEKNQIGLGTSSKSTKLIHGGLRYLRNPRDFHLVAEGLRERGRLLKLAPDLVHPLKFYFPVLNHGGMPRWMIKTGLWLYDHLAQHRDFSKHEWVPTLQAAAEVPGLLESKFRGFYSFSDGQTDDLNLTRRVAFSAMKLGANIVEEAFAQSMHPSEGGWTLRVLRDGQEAQEISARYVVNAMGPWAHEFMKRSSITPRVQAMNNQGTHILLEDRGLKAGLFLESPEDHRIFFVLPWLGKTLVGTTEDEFEKPADECVPLEHQINYLIERYNRYFTAGISQNDIKASFSGLRWLAKSSSSGLSSLSRSHLVTEHPSKEGILYTIYGGKLTAYRSLSEEVGDRIIKDFGDKTPTKTHLEESWALSHEKFLPHPLERFNSTT